MDDYNLAPSYHAIIIKAIQDQLSDFKAHSTTFGEDGDPQSPIEEVVVKGALADEDEKWWETWREMAKNDTTYKTVAATHGEAHSRKRRKVVKDEEAEAPSVPPAPDKDQPMSVDDFEEDESRLLEELRILVKVCRSSFFEHERHSN